MLWLIIKHLIRAMLGYLFAAPCAGIANQVAVYIQEEMENVSHTALEFGIPFQQLWNLLIPLVRHT